MKIDMSFIKDVDKNYIKQEIIKAMVMLASNINSIIIAEGIETREEFYKLKELGVTYGQGYLFAVPQENISEELNAF